MIDAPPDGRDTYINLRVNAERLTLPDANASSHPIAGTLLVRPLRPMMRQRFLNLNDFSQY